MANPQRNNNTDPVPLRTNLTTNGSRSTAASRAHEARRETATKVFINTLFGSAVLAVLYVAPGGYTGWLGIAVVLTLFSVAYRIFQPHGIFSVGGYVSASFGVALVVGYIVASLGPVPAYELSYRAPETPKAWKKFSVDYDSATYRAEPSGTTARIVTYEVPDRARTEASAYVKQLKKDGWRNVKLSAYANECPIVPKIKLMQSCDVVATQPLRDVSYVHLTRDGLVMTIDWTAANVVVTLDSEAPALLPGPLSWVS